jgi:O-antigen/teichoic acid export membrane protein
MKQLVLKLLKSSNFHSLAGNVSFAFFNAITFLVMARMLDKAVFGEWIIYLTASSLLNMLRLGLTGTGAIRSISLAKGEEEQAYIGATYKLGFITFIYTATLFYPAWFILKQFFAESYYYPVLLFYPLLSLVNLSYNQATVVTQAQVAFGKLFVLKAVHGISMLVLIGGYVYRFEPRLDMLILLHALSNFLPGLVAIIKGWDGLKYLRKSTKKHTKELLNFGKYSTLISVGSSLLRSADTFILSMSAVMGATSIAIYAIPMKFVEAVEIPLRSFSATAYPKLSQAFAQGKEKFNSLLHSYNVATTLLIMPIVLVLFVFAGPLLRFVGGAEYYESILLQKNILYIILIYILFLPSDRYTGVALFALDRPVKNFYKTMIMLGANVVFDLIAVFVFESLIAVALATLVFTLLGVYWGWFFVKKESGAKLSSIITEGRSIFRQSLLLLSKKKI